MPQFQKVAQASTIPPGTVRRVEAAGRPIALYNLAGQFFATDDCCTHAEGPLSEGYVSGEEVVCPLHAATFKIKTGEVTSGPAEDNLHTYPVRIVGADIEVEV